LLKKSPVFKMSVVAISAFVILAIAVICGIYMNYMEYLEIGQQYTSVFWVDFNAKSLTFGISFILFFAIVFMNFSFIRSNLSGIDNSFSYLKKHFWFVISSIVIAIILSVISLKTVSDTIMPFLNSEFFGKGDPIFYMDIGYYVFQRPFYIAMISMLQSAMAFMIFFTAIMYIIFYGKFDFYNMKNILKEKGVIIHLISLIIIYFIIKAVTYKFVQESILFTQNSGFVGADYTNIKVWLKYYNAIPIIIVLAVILTIIFILRQKVKHAICSVMVYPVAFIITTLIASIVNVMVVDPNEMSVQSEYIQHNIDYTRSAYNLDNVVERAYEINNDLNEEKIMNNLDTVDNIRITDFDQTVNVLNQLQSLKTYYSFSDSDIVTYTLGGETTAVSIAAREINTDKLDDSAKTYVNEKMRYTHSTGVVANKINSVNDNGHLDFIVKNIPVTSEYEELHISQPRIYYGETKNNYVIVGTKDGELDDINKEGYFYQGQGGIGLNFFNKIILAVREADFKMLVSSQITSNSKILLNTNIMERVKKIAPFLKYDSDPTIVVDTDGTLKWIIDAYTTTEFYPYAQYTGDINYIRNSVKVVVDAYNGTVKFYIIDQTDPIIKCYNKIYPDLFEKTSFPLSLKEHIRYPMDIFTMQSNILEKYHITNANEFYQRKGVWSVSNEKMYEGKSQPVKPYYNYMKVDGDKAELVLMLPYTLAGKDNMISWLAVRCTGENYGQMIINNFTQSENVSGTYQIENIIDSDSEISKDISLWESSGSSVIRGNMLVVPIQNNLLYVEPLYITSGTDGSSLPQLARIVVSYNDKVVSEPTLNGCFEKLFGIKRETKDEDEESLDDYIKNVINSYNLVKETSQSGDWNGFGKAMQRLDNDINNLNGQVNMNDAQSTGEEMEK